MIPWSEDGPTGAIQLLEMAMVTVGSDEPAEVHGFIERRLNSALHQWARTGRGSSHVEALWIAWSMMRFHTLAAAARYELSDSDVDRQEKLETIIIRIREAARKHQDWGLALQQLAAEIEPLLKPPW